MTSQLNVSDVCKRALEAFDSLMGEYISNKEATDWGLVNGALLDLETLSQRQQVTKTERGWGGHYIQAYKCLFRRNTLLEYGDKRYVVSTVGNCRDFDKDMECVEIGLDRIYETKVFPAEWDDPYWDADASPGPVSIDSKKAIRPPLEHHSDQEANTMHEGVVDEIASKMLDGVL